MNKKIILSLLLLMSFAFVSCERYPISKLSDLPSAVLGWPNPWYLYDDELNTKGSFEPAFWNKEPCSLRFDWTENVARGKKCIRFEYPATGSNGWVGFGLSSTEDLWGYGSKDMSTSAYKQLKFKVRGTLTSGCTLSVEIPRNRWDPDSGKWLSFADGSSKKVIKEIRSSDIQENKWTEFVIESGGIPDFDKIKTEEIGGGYSWYTQKYYIALSLGGGNGGTVYLDDIRFER